MTRLLIFLMPVLLAFLAVMPAQAQEKVAVRTGTHDDYQRVVFEWSAAPDYTVTRNGASVIMAFKKMATADLSGVSALENIQDVKVSAATGGNLSIALTIPGESKIRDIKIGNKIILDVYDPPGGRQKAQAPKAEEKQLTPAPAPEAEQKAQTPPATAAAPEPAPVQEASETQAAPAPVATTPPATAPTPTPAASAPAQTTPAPSPLEPHVMTVTATKKFGMALFERSGWLWIATDDPDSVAPVMAGPQVEKFGLLQRFDLDHGTIYRLKKPEGVGITVEGGDQRWRIVFSPNPKEVDSIAPERLSPVAAVTEPPAPRQGSSLLWPLKTAQTILSFKDPDIGDAIEIVTTTNSASAVRNPYRFVELETLPSYIGLAYVPLADGVSGTIQNGDVRISRGEKDLSLSMISAEPAQTEETHSSIPEETAELPPVNENNIYHLARWEMGGLRVLADNQNALMAGLAGKDESGRAEDFLTLGKLMLANNRGSEALGYLRTAEAILPSVAETAEFVALRGAAALIAGQPDLAVTDMTNKALDRYQDVPYWRMATFAALEDWQQAIATMPKDTKGINDYPATARQHLALTLAEVALRNGNVMEGERILADLEPAAGTMVPSDAAAWTYLMGEAARQLKQYEKAKEYWGKLAKGKDDYHRARAGLALTRLLLERNEIDAASAIDRLEGLRYAWRGDELEALVNYRLGRVYVDNNEYLKGFYVLRNAASLSPESHLAREVTNYMTQSFRTLFDSDKLQQISPLDAIGVYEEFKELSPAGAEGDRLVEQLAERMVDADLLPRAESLLDYQLQHRLKGPEAGRVALRVAAIRLLDNKPEGALKNLAMAEAAYKEGPEKTVPADKQREITLLRASALSKTGRADEAIAHLELLPSDKVVARLRADIAWKSQRWADAAEGLQTLIDVEQVRPDRPLTAEQADLILNRGIALNLAGDRVSLSTLRERYGSLMAQTPKANLFDVVTLPRRFGLIRSRDTIAESINNVDLFKDFLETYRKAEAAPPVAAQLGPAAAIATAPTPDKPAEAAAPQAEAPSPAETPNTGTAQPAEPTPAPNANGAPPEAATQAAPETQE